MPRINISIRLGPMVHFQVEGESCEEIVKALVGFERLNQTVDAMFSDLGQRVFPEAEEQAGEKAS